MLSWFWASCNNKFTAKNVSAQEGQRYMRGTELIQMKTAAAEAPRRPSRSPRPTLTPTARTRLSPTHTTRSSASMTASRSASGASHPASRAARGPGPPQYACAGSARRNPSSNTSGCNPWRVEASLCNRGPRRSHVAQLTNRWWALETLGQPGVRSVAAAHRQSSPAGHDTRGSHT